MIQEWMSEPPLLFSKLLFVSLLDRKKSDFYQNFQYNVDSRTFCRLTQSDFCNLYACQHVHGNLLLTGLKSININDWPIYSGLVRLVNYTLVMSFSSVERMLTYCCVASPLCIFLFMSKDTPNIKVCRQVTEVNSGNHSCPFNLTKLHNFYLTN